MQNMSQIDIFALSYKAAEEFKQAQRRGEDLGRFDFGQMPQCTHCNNIILRGKPMACSQCKAYIYCSKECQTKDWKFGKIPGAPTHKSLCINNKRHMERISATRGIVSQFPWGRVEADGTHALDFTRAMHGVLGGVGFGYWSDSNGGSPHLSNASVRGTGNYPGNLPSNIYKIDKVYRPGYMLLDEDHLDHKKAWMLEDGFIPMLSFKRGKQPELASKTTVLDWDSWYKWRGIPKGSPAAILMAFPMSAYQLIVHTLGMANPSGPSKGRRQRLRIHYLGAESELNMIPLFSELALLLPYTDIELVFFGPGVHDIVQQSRQFPQSLAARTSYPNKPIYTYASPDALGAGSLNVYLHGRSEYWNPDELAESNMPTPDVLIAANAGLTTYPAWAPVILFAHMKNLPFAVTEYAEQSAEVQVSSFPRVTNYAAMDPRMSPAQQAALRKKRSYRIDFNPFQRPGQRSMGAIRLPNMSNGFTIRVVGVDD